MSNPFKSEFLYPRYWPTWLLIGVLRLLMLLSQRWQYRLGRWLGMALYYLLPGRRHVAEVNLKLCFPELDAAARKAQVKAVFRHNGTGLLETAMTWWAPTDSFKSRSTVIGLEHLQQAQAAGRGVILLGGHYSALDMGGALVSPHASFECFYRPQNNALFDYWANRGRLRFADDMLPHDDMRNIVRRLRKGTVVWFAPDQDQGPTHSIYAPFFGVPAATVTSTARLAKMTGAAVVPLGFHRLADGQYEVEFRPALEGFPGGGDLEDAARINGELEQLIRKHPTQYMWVHRRFKTHPKGKNYLYR